MAEKIITSDFEWSFSKLSAYETCPYYFYLQYLQDPPLPKQQNAFAEFGILCHQLLEEFGNGWLNAEELVNEYDDRYNKIVVHNFPPYPAGYAQKTYQQGLEYFQNFKGFPDGLEVVSTEETFHIDINGNKFVGISDLVMRDIATGELHVFDHKTKSQSSMATERDHYVKQLYIYAEHVFRKYGQYPKTIRFNMIKSQSEIIEEFSKEKLDNTLQWVSDTIDRIYLESDWEAHTKNYFCRNICSVFPYCDFGMSICSKKS